MRRLAALLAGLVAVALTLAAATLAIAGRVERWPREAASEAALAGATPLQGGRAGYLGSDRCLACHPGEHASWAATYHRTMTQRASPTAILAPFDGRALVGVDAEYRVERRGDEHWVEMVDPEWKLAAAVSGEPLRSGPMVWRRVVMTTGSHHLQVYWVASADGLRLHAFPFSYLIAEARWVPNESTLLRPPEGDAVYTWNQVCIQCHAVAGIPGEGDDGDPQRSRTVELGIACEACHGPGGEHAARHRGPLARYREHLAQALDPARGDPTIVNPARLDHRAASEICGQCHSASIFADEAAWRREGPPFRPGARLEPAQALVRHPARADAAWLDAILEADPGFIEGRLWGDGMVRVIGRELSGLVESPCYQRGELSCLSCHQLHGADPNDQLAPGMAGDAACTGCHPAYADAAAAAAHSHHPATSAASRCYNCHMPHTTYGLLKASRSHEVDVPDPLVSATSGRPNACNLCHLDQTLEWSAEHLERWYGRPAPALEGDAREVAAGVLWAVAGDASQRALVAWHMGWEPALAAAGDGWEAPILALLLEDPYDAVRMIAARSLAALPGYADLEVDAVAPPATRAAQAAAIRERWAASGDRRGDPQLLREADGRPREAALAELLARRDQRPIDLRE